MNLCRKIPQPRPAAPAKRNEPEKSIFASLLETISSTLTKTVENIEKQKLEDIDDNDGDRDQVLKTTTATTTTTAKATEKYMEITTEAPETTSRYIGGGRRHEENDVLETSDNEATSANQTENGEIIERKKSTGFDIETDADIKVDTEEEEDVFVDYSNDNDWTPLSPHGRLVVRDDD